MIDIQIGRLRLDSLEEYVIKESLDTEFTNMLQTA